MRRAVNVLVVAGAVAVLAGCTDSPPDPSPSSSRASSAPPSSASPTPTPTPSMLSTVTVDPLLPDARPLPAGLLASTDDSWTLLRAYAIDAGSTRTVVVEYLVSPAGERYELPPQQAMIEAWRPGETTALASALDQASGTVAVGTLDLETGVFTPVDLGPALAPLGATDQDASVTVAQAPGSSLLVVEVSNADTSAGQAVLDPATGAVSGERELAPGTWPSPDRSHFLLLNVDTQTVDVVVSANGASSRAPDVPDCPPSYVGWISDRLWFAPCQWTDPADATVQLALHSLDGATWTIPSNGDVRYYPLTVTGDTVWLSALDPSLGDAAPFTLVTTSPAGGVQPVELPGGQMYGYRAVAPGRLVATADPAVGADGYGFAAPLVGLDLAARTATTLLPEPTGSSIVARVHSDPGLAIYLWHTADGKLEPGAD